ncbi:MAG TPA: universal stress protein [Terracidiphilus sp.]|jgi:nucleotide-binding universal stress UspA family protein|nr:universal stress protein [Terracidiphilus sp.]
MPKIKHILFPVDFSERSAGAAPFVAAMAAKYDAQVTLLTAAHANFAGGLAGAPMIDPQTILDAVEEQLSKTYVEEFAGLLVSRVTVPGEPVREIVDYVAAQPVDLVMMTTHGHGPFRQLLLGSVAAKVLHDVHVPVWTTAHSGEAPARVHLAMRKVLCAVEADPAGVDLLRWASEFCKTLGADLRLVHAVPGIEAWPEQDLGPEFQDTLRENARRIVQDLAQAAGVDAPISVGTGTVPDVVREEAVKQGSDLVVIGRGVLQATMGRLRTHAYGIIRNAPCPVLSV